MNKREIRRYLKYLNDELKKKQVFSILELVYPGKLIEPKVQYIIDGIFDEI